MRKYLGNRMGILFIIAMLLAVSVLFNINLRKKTVSLSSKTTGKTVVNMWLKASQTGTTLLYQVNKYNDENTDNIFINLKIYKEDYNNLLTTSMACNDGPDIFQYTSYDLIKNNHILDLSKLSIDKSIIGSRDYIYYNTEPVGTKYTDDTVKLFVNKDLLKKAGIENPKINCWQDVLDICKEIKQSNPKIIPFGFQYNNYESLKGSFGVPSEGNNNIYSSFYNYKTGKYDYSQMKNILDIYADMYQNGYISKDFNELNVDKLRYDFYSGNTAIMIGSYLDKSLFSTNLSLFFNVGIYDVPSAAGSKAENFSISANNFMCVNKDAETSGKLAAIKKVYSWFFSQDNLTQLFKTKQALPSILENRDNAEDVYNIFNTKLKDEEYDPSPFIPLDILKIKDLINDSIKNRGNLNKNLDKIINITEDNANLRIKENGIDINNYIKQD